MNTASALKIRGTTEPIFNRGLVNFDRHVEMGIDVPMIDHRFLNSYKLVTSKATPVNSSIVQINSALGKDVVKKYISNFDDELIVNGFIGPSSSSGYKGSIESRPLRRNDPIADELAADRDIFGNANSVRVALSDGDNIAIARHPDGIYEVDTIPANLSIAEGTRIDPNFTLRTPRLMNVHDHANSMIGNIPDATTEYIVFPVTDRGSISPRSIYKFTFYYRMKGTVKVTPIVQYFSDASAVPVDTKTWSETTLSATDATENTDFTLFDFMIPNVHNRERIRETARRMRIILKLETTEDSIFELAYPIIEHSFDNSPAVSVVLPEEPSSVNHSVENASSIKASPVNTNIVVNPSALFFGHIGRRLFKVSLSYSLLDSNVVGQLRTIENFNTQGDPLVLRAKHHDLPPVMIGNMELSNSAALYDYHFNDATINFQETT